MKPSDVAKVVPNYFQDYINTIIVGPPAIGKSAVINQMINKLGWQAVTMMPAISDPTDFKGMPWVAKDHESATFLPFGDLLQLLQADEPTVCFMDDYLHASQAVQAATMHLLWAREIGGHKISNEVRFVAATNDRMHKSAVNNMIEPVKSRFVFITMEADLNDWLLWAAQNVIRSEIRAFARTKGSLFNDDKPTKGLENKPSPRTFENLSKVINTNPPSELELECYTGAVGKSCAAEFCAYLKTYKDLPNPDLIFLNPTSAPMPQDAGALVYLCASIASRTNPSNIEQVCIYAERMLDGKTFDDGDTRDEFAAYLIKDSAATDKSIMEEYAFIQFGSKNKSLMGL